MQLLWYNRCKIEQGQFFPRIKLCQLLRLYFWKTIVIFGVFFLKDTLSVIPITNMLAFLSFWAVRKRQHFLKKAYTWQVWRCIVAQNSQADTSVSSRLSFHLVLACTRDDINLPHLIAHPSGQKLKKIKMKKKTGLQKSGARRYVKL